MYIVKTNIISGPPSRVLKKENVEKENIIDAINLMIYHIEFADSNYFNTDVDYIMGKIEIINEKGFLEISCNIIDDIFTIGVDLDGTYLSRCINFDDTIKYLDGLKNKIQGTN